MRETISRTLARLAASLAGAVASVGASILLPSVVITVYAVGRRDADRIGEFARMVAEPLGLLGAVAATYGVARFALRLARDRALITWVAGGAATAMLAAATWVFDFDWWTAVAAAVVPAAAIYAGRRSRPFGPQTGALSPRPPHLQVGAPAADALAGAPKAAERVER